MNHFSLAIFQTDAIPDEFLYIALSLVCFALSGVLWAVFRHFFSKKDDD